MNLHEGVTRSYRISPPSIWGDQFLAYHQRKDEAQEEQQVERLRDEVRKQLMIKDLKNPQSHMNALQLIDVVQHLGIAYHFEQEIENALHLIYITYDNHWIDDNNLQSTSLWFRLLRQEGFNVSAGIFKKYMDEKKNFMESLSNDVVGMLALYEASYMRVDGEKVLDDALEFTTIHLGNLAKDPVRCPSSFKIQIQQALSQPLRKRLPRLEALHYIPIYQLQASHNETLLKLTKLDFNLLQSLHRKELSQICKWWNDLDTQKNLPYVRDRLVEGFFWVSGIYFEPKHSKARIFITKACMLILILDDTYDSYGTHEELVVFTEAIQRWSEICLDMLPQYMKFIYKELLNVHKEMEEILEKDGKAYQSYYVKEMVKDYAQKLLMEANWVHEGYVPTLDEHQSVTTVTVGNAIMIVTSYVNNGDMVTEDTFKWVSTYPPIMKASCLIARLMNDIATHKEEQERNHVPSTIECYIKQYGMSEVEVIELLSKKVDDAWKVINQECIRRPINVSMALIKPIINLSCTWDVIYKGGSDGYGHAGKEMKTYIKKLLVEPMNV